jgi:hypothetical protein
VGDRRRAVIDSLYPSSLSQTWISKWITSVSGLTPPSAMQAVLFSQEWRSSSDSNKAINS